METEPTLEEKTVSEQSALDTVADALNTLSPNIKTVSEKTAIIRKYLDTITAAQKRGVTAAKIADKLTDITGVPFTVTTFRFILAREKRRKEGEEPV